ncbi:MAG TPA: ABC transporter permease subunit, partial [Verrucomicrobiota bacterium]|nr:ABC transporter permease subunit [Verrucomicrobiota bacterium]
MFRERMARVGPVLVRELRAQARSPVLRRVRMAAAVAAIGALALLGGASVSMQAGDGKELFVLLHGGMILLLGLLGPALTADAVSRERREGTLPLLWLCSLRPGDVLLGKLAAHGLLLFAAWLAAAPVLLVPLLLGGVSLEMIMLLLALEAGVGGVCLASGLLASTWSRHAERSLLSAYFIAGSVVALGFWLGAFAAAAGSMALAAALPGLPPWLRVPALTGFV